jgi:protein involved in polysaccharide export with SLBB domain
MTSGPSLLSRLAVLFFVCLSAACSSAPDKRILQYLNTDGFGNRYTGNAEEENWLAIGDTLVISDSYNDELSLSKSVGIDGTVLLPELGAVAVAGLTRTELEALLMEKYSPYLDLLDIKVEISTQGKKYFVYGEVGSPGDRVFPGDLTIFEAVMAANPNKDTANLGRVRLIRADPRDPFIQTVNIGDMIEKGDSTFNVHVQERDIIYVPPTMLAQLGYFLDTLLFPVKQVLSGLGQAIFTYDRLRYGGGQNQYYY